MGGMADDQEEAKAPDKAFTALGAQQGLLIAPHLLRLEKSVITNLGSHESVDTSIYGDVLANHWNIYSFGRFDMQCTVDTLVAALHSSFAKRYHERGVECQADGVGFAHIFNIPHSMGKEIHIVDENGQWHFGRDITYQGIPHKSSINHAWRWPLVTTTGTVPTMGQRLGILGALKELRDIPLCGDSFANDALWRVTPQTLWANALTVATHGGTNGDDCMDLSTTMESITINLPMQTGVNTRVRQVIDRERLATLQAMARLPWEERRKTTQVKKLGTVQWPNIETGDNWSQTKRNSLQLGPQGSVGQVATKEFGRYPGSSAFTDANSLGGEDFTAHFTRPTRPGHRYSTSDLATHRGFQQWACTYPMFTYKRAWYAERAFNTGMYGFHFEPYIHELIRLIHRGKLSFGHLFAPSWFIDTIGEFLCRRKGCPDRWGECVRGREPAI